MTHREILNGEGCFGESYADTFSDCPSNIDTSVLEDDSSSEYSSDSDGVHVRPTKRQKTWVIGSDLESENEAVLRKTWQVSGVTIEYNSVIFNS